MAHMFFNEALRIAARLGKARGLIDAASRDRIIAASWDAEESDVLHSTVYDRLVHDGHLTAGDGTTIAATAVNWQALIAFIMQLLTLILQLINPPKATGGLGKLATAIFLAIAVLCAGNVQAQVLEPDVPGLKDAHGHCRGARPSPLVKLKATPLHVAGPAPAEFAVVPKQRSMFGNDAYGDCVTAEEAENINHVTFQAYGASGEQIIPTANVVNYCRKHGTLNGASLTEVLDSLNVSRKDGLLGSDGKMYCVGPYSQVDYTDEANLRSAIAQSPVKLGIDASPLNGSGDGWTVLGGRSYRNEDHSIHASGYGTPAFLYGKLGLPVPSNLNQTQVYYLLYTWSMLFIVDHASLKGFTSEAWLRSPDVYADGVLINPTPVPPPPPPGPSPLAIAGYSSNPASAGSTITVTGTGFVAPAIFGFSSFSAAMNITSPTSAMVTLPAVTSDTTDTPDVLSGGYKATGPALTVSAAPLPPPINATLTVTTPLAAGNYVIVAGGSVIGAPGSVMLTPAEQGRLREFRDWTDGLLPTPSAIPQVRLRSEPTVAKPRPTDGTSVRTARAAFSFASYASGGACANDVCQVPGSNAPAAVVSPQMSTARRMLFPNRPRLFGRRWFAARRGR